jgi:hypothetical protein
MILLSAGIAERRQAGGERAGRLAGELDWSRLTERLRARKLLPTLGPRILELAGPSAGETFASAVEEAITSGRRQGSFLELLAVRVMAMLAEAGIPSTSLKGPLLAERIYGDPARRLSGDVDLLVAPEHLPAAVEVVRGLGYGAPTNHVDRDGLPLLHFALIHDHGELPPVELHWRIHWYERRFARERLLAPAQDPGGEWRPALADELAALLLFYGRDGFVDLRLAADLSGWWDAFGSDLPRGALDECLHTYPALARVLSAAVKAAERIVGLPAAHIIGDMPKAGFRDQIAIRLANPNPDSSQAQIYADIGLIDGLLAPEGGFGGFVRRQVLPPHAVLEEQARHAGRRRAASPLSRCVGMLARYSLTMSRLLRSPETL